MSRYRAGYRLSHRRVRKPIRGCRLISPLRQFPIFRKVEGFIMTRTRTRIGWRAVIITRLMT